MRRLESNLPQRTLNSLILQVIALEPIDGDGLAQRLQNASQDVLQVQQGSIDPAMAAIVNLPKGEAL